MLAHGRWFSPGTPASSITKTGRHDIAEILLKVALNNQNQAINQLLSFGHCNVYPYSIMSKDTYNHRLSITTTKHGSEHKYSKMVSRFCSTGDIWRGTIMSNNEERIGLRSQKCTVRKPKQFTITIKYRYYTIVMSCHVTFQIYTSCRYMYLCNVQVTFMK